MAEDNVRKRPFVLPKCRVVQLFQADLTITKVWFLFVADKCFFMFFKFVYCFCVCSSVYGVHS